jgi:F-type H+-transporting ATPase subunit epsilon
LHVELVAADRTVWSGEASRLLARTLDGDLGILPGHTPLLGVLAAGQVRITPESGGVVTAEVDGGLLSVENDRVLVVAEQVSVDGGTDRAGR